MSEYTELQQKVIDRVKEMCEDKPWFSGVNVTNLPEDYEILRDGVEEWTGILYCDTAFYDAWDDNGFLGFL